MKLTPEQLKRFDEQGYLFFPNYFSLEETQILKESIPEVFAQRREENVREKSGDVVRTAFAVHTYHPVFEALVHHPRFVEPAEQFLRDRTYIHQFKINGKAAFDGDVWQWHQDYGTWKADDDMPEARAMNLAVFVDEVNEFNGPLWFIPQSHKKGAIEAKHDLTTTSYPLWVIDNDTIAKLVEQGGIVAPKGGPGSAIFFHGTLVHGSPPNMSPWDRQIIYVTYNAVSNAIRRFKRPAHIAHRDFMPIDAWEDDAVLRAARRRQVRLHVPVADPDHARHSSSGHRRPLAAARAGKPGAAGLEAGGHVGRLVRRGTPPWQHASHRGLARPGEPSRNRHHRRSHRRSDRRRRACAGSLQ